MVQHHLSTGGRYPVLRTIAILWLISAVLALAGGIYQAVAALLDARGHELLILGGGAISSRVIACLIWLSATFFVVILNVAVAELIKLAIDLEHNTRMAARTASGAAAEPIVSRREDREEMNEESAEAALIRGH